MTTVELIILFWIVLIFGGATAVVTYIIVSLALAQLRALGFYIKTGGSER